MGKNIQYNRLNSLSEQKTKVFFLFPTEYHKEVYNVLKQEANKGTFTYDNIVELPAPQGKSKCSTVISIKTPNNLEEILLTIYKAMKDKVKIIRVLEGKIVDLPAHNMKEITIIIQTNREKEE